MGQSKALYAVGRVVCKPIFKLLYRYETIIEEPLPLEGGMIIASNHLSNSDPVLLGLSQKKRRLFFMAKIELFKNKFFGALIRALGAFPVERGAGDGKAIKTGEDLIRDGEIMTIFIEGGRSKTGELMRPRSGCALVAQQMQVPVVPACITQQKAHFCTESYPLRQTSHTRRTRTHSRQRKTRTQRCNNHDYGRNQKNEGAGFN